MGAGEFSVSSWFVFWRVLGQCISLVLVFYVDWVCIVLKMFWLFSVSICTMGSVIFWCVGACVHLVLVDVGLGLCFAYGFKSYSLWGVCEVLYTDNRDFYLFWG